VVGVFYAHYPPKASRFFLAGKTNMPNKEQLSLSIPKRLLSKVHLNISDLELTHDLDWQISTVERQLNSIESSYAWHGQSPLNERGYVAPRSPEAIETHSQLSQAKYNLELNRFFSTFAQNPEVAVKKMYWLTQRLGQFQPDVVRNDLGDHYVTWLETATQTLALIDHNSPQFKNMVPILESHLDVTQEFDELKTKLDGILAAAILGLADSTPPTTAAVAAT
jgi:hypothetical protein